MWCKGRAQQEKVRAIPICILRHSGMQVIKLLKFCCTRNFLDWYTYCFCPTFPCFCQENEFPAKALLFDNAHSHPTKLAGVRTLLDGRIVCLPSNTTSLLQPMDHRLIAAFRGYSPKPSWQWWEFWTSQKKLSRIIGAHWTIWRALITSVELGRKCQWTVWMEVHFTLPPPVTVLPGVEHSRKPKAACS